MQEPIDLLVSGGTVVTQNPAREIIAGGAVAIDGSRIVAVGPAMELDTCFEAHRRIDSTGRYVFPGLINTHTHLYQTFMKGLGEGLPLYQWIDEITAPSTVAMTPREGYLSAVLGGIEALRSGTTTVLDFMYSMPRTDLYRSVAEALGDLGLRGVLARGFMDYGEHHGMPLCQLYPVDRALAEWDDLRAELAAPLFSFALAPEIPFAVSREGLRALLTREPDILVVGEAGDGREALRVAQETRPDVAALDLSMPLLNGLEASRQMARWDRGPRSILLTMHSEDRYVIEALRAGVRGYVLKKQAAADLVRAIREVAAGAVYLSPGVSAAASIIAATAATTIFVGRTINAISSSLTQSSSLSIGCRTSSTVLCSTC